MVTTRIVEVASTTMIDRFRGNIFHLKALSPEESRKLFWARTFQGKSCPHHLLEISEHFLKGRRGLPLAIVTISGVLATKDTSKINDWEMIRRSLRAEFDSIDKLRNMKKILSLSFNDLSYQLKSCLPFMSMCPEDWSYKMYYVTQLWTAQGFVQEMEGRTPEEVGELYFNELCNRSLLQTVMENIDESENEFCIHDLLRDVILQKSKDQNFAVVATEGNPFLLESVRHLFLNTTLEDLQGDRNNFSRLRTLHLSSAKGSISSSSISAFFSKYGGLRLLKVLDYEGLPLETISECITQLFNLRYLNSRGTRVASIPRSIGRLRNIEILELGDTLIEELPAEITQLHRVRFINVFHSIDDGSLFHKLIGARVLKETGKLASLQNLYLIQASEGGLDLMRSLGNLKPSWKSLPNLVFCSFGRLRKMKVEQGAMPRLQLLGLEDCKSMEEVPSGVEFLSHLKQLGLINMGDLLLTRLSSSIEDSDFSRVKHVPNVFIGLRDADGLHGDYLKT